MEVVKENVISEQIPPQTVTTANAITTSRPPIQQTTMEDLMKKDLEQLAYDFVMNLNRQFHNISPALHLYANMMEKNRKKVVTRTMVALNNFYNEHFQDIIMADFSMFDNYSLKIICTTNAYIELDKLWNVSSFETKTVIWDYINQFACLYEPRLKLSKLNANTREKFGYMKDPEQIMSELRNTPEGELLNNIMSELQGVETSNPMLAIMNLVQSGKLEKIQQHFTNGDININRILQSATGMLQSLVGKSNILNAVQPQSLVKRKGKNSGK